ncbi:hypothetical protein EUZ93_00995, partial [Wolbachia pipientis]|nr:hypothetical protein [Wolbachia pipientis]
MPSIGIKLDSIPGRLNQSIIILNRPGIESNLIPIDGIVHAWITSKEV